MKPSNLPKRHANKRRRGALSRPPRKRKGRFSLQRQPKRNLLDSNRIITTTIRALTNLLHW